MLVQNNNNNNNNNKTSNSNSNFNNNNTLHVLTLERMETIKLIDTILSSNLAFDIDVRGLEEQLVALEQNNDGDDKKTIRCKLEIFHLECTNAHGDDEQQHGRQQQNYGTTTSSRNGSVDEQKTNEDSLLTKVVAPDCWQYQKEELLGRIQELEQWHQQAQNENQNLMDQISTLQAQQHSNKNDGCSSNKQDSNSQDCSCQPGFEKDQQQLQQQQQLRLQALGLELEKRSLMKQTNDQQVQINNLENANKLLQSQHLYSIEETRRQREEKNTLSNELKHIKTAKEELEHELFAYQEKSISWNVDKVLLEDSIAELQFVKKDLQQQVENAKTRELELQRQIVQNGGGVSTANADDVISQNDQAGVCICHHNEELDQLAEQFAGLVSDKTRLEYQLTVLEENYNRLLQTQQNATETSQVEWNTLRQRNEEHYAELVRTQQTLRSCQEETKFLQDKVTLLESENLSMEDSLEDANGTILTMEADKDNSTAQSEKVASKQRILVKTLEAEVAFLQSERTSLQRKVHELKVGREKWKCDLVKVGREASTLREEKERLANELQQLQSIQNKSKCQLRTFEEASITWHEEKRLLEERLIELEYAKSIIEGHSTEQMETLRTDKAFLEERLFEVEHAKTSLQKELEEARETIKVLTTDNELLENRLLEVYDDNDDDDDGGGGVKSENTVKTSKHRQQIQELNSDLEHLEGLLREAQNIIELLEGQLSDAEEQINKLSNNDAGWENKLKELEKLQIDICDERIHAKLERANLKEQVSIAREAKDHAEQQLEDAMEMIASLQREKTSLQNESENAAIISFDMEQQNETLRLEKHMLESQICFYQLNSRSQEEEETNESTELNFLTVSNDQSESLSVQDDLDAWINEKKCLEKQLAELERWNATLQHELKQMNGDMESMEKAHQVTPIASTQSIASNFKAQLEVLRNSTAVLLSKRDSLAARVQELETSNVISISAELDEIKEQKNQLEVQLLRFKQEDANRRDCLDTTMAALRKAIAQAEKLEKEVELANEQANTAIAELTAVKSKMERHEEAYDKLRDKHVRTIDFAKKLQRDKARLETEIKHLQTTVGELQGRLSGIEEAILF